jgi:hypothetical protein
MGISSRGAQLAVRPYERPLQRDSRLLEEAGNLSHKINIGKRYSIAISLPHDLFIYSTVLSVVKNFVSTYEAKFNLL